jgi:hypothetical protein
LELRHNDPASFMPAFNDDGNLIALAPTQVYLPKTSDFSTSTVFVSFDLAAQRCLSLFSVFNPLSAGTVGVIWGANDAYLLWQKSVFDAPSGRQVFSTDVARVALEGLASSGIAAFSTLADSVAYPAFLEERDGYLIGAVENIGAEYRRGWSYCALDRSLELTGSLSLIADTDAARLGSFALAGDRVYLYAADAAGAAGAAGAADAVAGTDAEGTDDEGTATAEANVADAGEGFMVLDISEVTQPELLARSSFAGWPQKFAELDAGFSSGSSSLFVGYGSELIREQQTMAGVNSNLVMPSYDQLATLELIALDANGNVTLGELQLLPRLEGFESWSPSWSYDLHVFRDLGLVGVPLFSPDPSHSDSILRTKYLLYAVDAGAGSGVGASSGASPGASPGTIQPVAVIDLLTGQNLSLAAMDSLAGLFADDGYSTVLPSYDESSIYLLCAPSSSSSLLPTQLIVISRTTYQVTQILSVQ